MVRVEMSERDLHYLDWRVERAVMHLMATQVLDFEEMMVQWGYVYKAETLHDTTTQAQKTANARKLAERPAEPVRDPRHSRAALRRYRVRKPFRVRVRVQPCRTGSR